MILEECILMGRTVPEPSKKYGVTVCGICYSPEMRSFIRIYPLLIDQFKIKRRGIFKANLKAPRHDCRKNSYKIIEYEDSGNEASLQRIKEILEKRVDTINALNIKKKSIGIIKPCQFDIKMRRQKKVEDDRQLKLFEDIIHNDFLTGRNYPIVPCIVTYDQEQNIIPLRDWQIFELMRKKDYKDHTKRKIVNLFNGKETFFVVGNILQFQNRWLAVTYFTYKINSQLSLPGFSKK